MIPAGFSCSDCRFPGNGNSAEMGKVCQDGNWGLKSRHSASPANSFCSGESPFWQAGRASISCTVGLAAPLLYPEQHLMSEQPQAWRCFIPGQGSSLFHHLWSAPARDVWREGREMPLEGCPKQAQPSSIPRMDTAPVLLVPQGHVWETPQPGG